MTSRKRESLLLLLPVVGACAMLGSVPRETSPLGMSVSVPSAPPLRWSPGSGVTNRAAVLIAADSYDENLSWALPSARTSADAMRAMLIERGGLSRDAIEVLAGRDVTSDFVEAAIRRAGARMLGGEPGILWVYYCGHGWVQDGQQQMFTFHTHEEAGRYQKVLARDDLVGWMAHARGVKSAQVDLVLVVDACRRNVGDPPPRAKLIRRDVWEMYGVKEGQLVAAGDGGEGFAFTRALVSAAAALSVSNFEADLERLFDEARARTLELTTRQEPEFCRPVVDRKSPAALVRQRVRFGVRVVDALTEVQLPDARVTFDDQAVTEDAGELRVAGSASEHVIAVHAAGYLTRTERLVLTPEQAGAVVEIPLQPALTILRGRVDPPGIVQVRATCEGARAGYHLLASATDPQGFFELRLPALRGTRVDVVRDGKSLVTVPIPDAVDSIRSDRRGEQDGIGIVEVRVTLPDGREPPPPNTPIFTEDLDRADWDRMMRLVEAGRFDLARNIVTRLAEGPAVAHWRRWIVSRWAERCFEEALRDGKESGDWSKLDAVVGERLNATSVDNVDRLEALRGEVERERMPLAARRAYEAANAAFADGRLEDALSGYQKARPEVTAHYRALIDPVVQRTRARLYERHMNASMQAELDGDWAMALESAGRALEHSERARSTVTRLLGVSDLAASELGRALANKRPGVLGDWDCEVLDPTPGTQTGHPHRVRDNRSGIIFLLVEPGEFQMGSIRGRDNERPLHRVRITRPFYLAETETTQEQWSRVMPENPSTFRGPTRPVDSVTWLQATEFARALNGNSAHPFRLPFEAEWEFAARAGRNAEYGLGDTISTDQANFDGTHSSAAGGKGVARGQTVDAGSLQANDWGFHDMHGNLAEWCQDWYRPDVYAGREAGAVDPRGPAVGTGRVMRGGSWRSEAEFVRCALRTDELPANGFDYLGFRLARSL